MEDAFAILTDIVISSCKGLLEGVGTGRIQLVCWRVGIRKFLLAEIVSQVQAIALLFVEGCVEKYLQNFSLNTF